MSNQLIEVIEKTAERFNAIAPSSMKFDAERGFAIQLLNNNNYLAKAAQESPASLAQAITNVAAIGLSLNPAEKLAYLIPRSVKVGNGWQTRVFLEPSYMGMIRLATDSGSIKWAQAYCVYAADKFTDNGAGNKPTHEFNSFAKDRGEFVGVYCVAKTIDGDYLTTTMTADEVHSVRDRSESWKRNQSGPWATDFTEQAKKTVIRRAFKTWPRTDERRMAMLAQAVELSNQNEGFEPILTTPEIGRYTADQKAYFDQLIQNSDALGMLAFVKTLNDEALFTNLYHSFEKGQKGKFQRIVDELIKEGSAKLIEFTSVIEEAMQANDSFKALEIVEGLAEDVYNMVNDALSAEARIFINEVQKEANVA